MGEILNANPVDFYTQYNNEWGGMFIISMSLHQYNLMVNQTECMHFKLPLENINRLPILCTLKIEEMLISMMNFLL